MTRRPTATRPGPREIFFGDGAWPDIARDSLRALLGSPHMKASRWGPSSLRVLKPSISLPTWLGLRRNDGRVPLYNFFNRVPAPRDQGYSVRVTHARDFRGGRFTYDGHLGTDFACPVGTPVVAPAPGVVTHVHTDMGYGGLKVGMDHGEGLFTTVCHLSRPMVSVGQRLARGDRLGLSGASGLELLLFFPWVSPHLHFNVWLDGEAVDPFARPGEESLWRSGNDPRPGDGRPVPGDADWRPSDFSAEGVEDGIAACRDEHLRDRVRAKTTLAAQATELMLVRSFASSAFDAFPALYVGRHVRRPRLDLPFRHEDYGGAALPPPPATGSAAPG